jgi:hypothetical protein
MAHRLLKRDAELLYAALDVTCNENRPAPPAVLADTVTSAYGRGNEQKIREHIDVRRLDLTDLLDAIGEVAQRPGALKMPPVELEPPESVEPEPVQLELPEPEPLLLDEIDVSFVPSAKVLVAARARTTVALSTRRLVGVAAPAPIPSHPPLAWAGPELSVIRQRVNRWSAVSIRRSRPRSADSAAPSWPAGLTSSAFRC